MVIVDIYARVSTDPQEDNTSLDEQEAVGRQYSAEHGLHIGMVHREVFSGYQYREREKLDLMRQRYREGTIHGVVIRTLDRLSRSQVHNAILMEEMEHHHATLYCVKEAIDDTPMGKFIRMVLAFVAEMEREKIMDRTTTGRINKAKAGKVVSGSKAPYGWTWLYDDRGEKTVVIDEEQAAILKWLAEQYADGVAAYNLMNQLNERGVPAPLGQEWSHQTVVRLLSDPRITGKGAKIFAYQQRKTKQPLEPIDLPDGTYPAIISEELFARIQQRREVNKADAIRASKEPEQYLLRAGFVRCGHCNKPMMAVKHRSQYIYRCTHTDLNHTNVILAHPLDAQIWDWLQQLADHVTLIETAIELATSSGKREHDTAAIEHSIAIWQTKAQNYLSDLDDATLIEDTRTAVRSALNNATKIIIQLEEERAQIMAGRVDKERERAAYQEILAWCNQVKEGRAELTYQRKRDFLRMLGVVVVVQNQKPYYQHMDYRIQVALPTIQELLTPHALVNCGASSPEDIQVTEQLVQAGRLLDIELVDHIIIGNQRYVSLKERLRW
ncbi:MAG: recombinase family protein [Chloroflexota bacterium]|nr:recombinase family protein [Chloroflexota bacterium]